MRHPAILTAVVCGAICLIGGGLRGAPIDSPLPDLPPADPIDAPPDSPAVTTSGPRPIPQTGGNIWARDARLQSPAAQLARDALRAGNIDACLAHLQTAFEEDPSLPPPPVAMAHLHLGEGRLQAALIALNKAAGPAKHHPELYLTCGQLAMLDRRPVDAGVHFEKALLLPKPGDWTDMHKRSFAITCLAGLADVAEGRQDWTGAAEVLAKWSEVDPDNGKLLDRWAQALFLGGRHDEALKKFRTAHEQDPTISPAELSIAAMHMRIGDVDGAKTWYTQALEAYPEDARPHFEYGGALLVAGETEKAAEQIDKAVEVGTNLDALGIEVPLMRGYLARSQKDYEAAESHFMSVLEQSPGHFQALHELPLVLVEQSSDAKRKRALQLATISARKHPGAAPALAALGWVHYRLGNIDDAEPLLRQAARGSDPESLYFAAQILLEKGDANEARDVVKRLEAALDRPGLMVLREEAREWVKTASLAYR